MLLLAYRVRSLYAYEGEGDDDLSEFFASLTVSLLTTMSVGFPENVILTANPSKTGGDWWYGTLLSNGHTGLFPKTYVQPVIERKCPLAISTSLINAI